MLFAGSISEVVTISAQVVPSSLPSPASDTTGRGTIINMPTIINFSGKAISFSKVSIFRDGKFINEVTTDKNSNFYLSFTVYNTNVYEFTLYGEDINNEKSVPFSILIYTKNGTIISVSNINLLYPAQIKNETTITDNCSKLIGDLNCDGHVNLIDFSIMAYWYNRINPPKKVDLNHDGKVSLIDFSIMMFNWTG